VLTSGKKRLGDILLEDGRITEEQLKQGLKLQREKSIPLGKALEYLGFITQDEIIAALSNQLGMPYVSLLEEASEKLIKVLDIDKLLNHILDIARKGLNADRGTIYIVDKNEKEIWSKVLIGESGLEIKIPIGKGIAGHVAKTGETINIADAYKEGENKQFYKEIDDKTGYKTKSVLCMPVKNSKNEIVGVFQMLNKKDGSFVQKDEEFLKSLSNYTSTALELSALYQEVVEKKRIENELSIAREIQVSLLPHSIPEIGGYEIFGSNNSCEEVSGDYYDFFSIGDNRWVFAIGDVSGKGVPASLVMAILQSHLKAITKLDNPLSETTKLINEYLVENSTPDKFITFFFGVLDVMEQTFEYVNAGHNPPFFISHDKSVQLLKASGSIIGMFPNLEYTQEKIALNKGDLIFCFTDGVTEYFNKDKEEFGEERLLEFLKKNYNRSGKDIFNRLLTTLDEFSSGEKQTDDITVLMLKKK